jgi:hypothetical protein
MHFTQHPCWEPHLVYVFLDVLLTGKHILLKLHKEYYLVAFESKTANCNIQTFKLINY